MRFDFRWISDQQLAAIAELAASTNHLPGSAVEVGVYQGLSTVSIANAVYPGLLYAVDNWLGSRDDPETVAAGKAQTDAELVTDNYKIFLDNVIEGTQGNIVVKKMSWQEFAKDWSGPVRFMHIDGTHTFSQVSGNITAFLPFAVPGAIFCGDDYGPHAPGVIGAVQHHFPGSYHTGPGALWWAGIGTLRWRNGE